MDESKFSKSDKTAIYTNNAQENGLPKDAYVQVTDKCNLDCLFCTHGQKQKHFPHGRIETLTEIITALRVHKFNWVTLWGGEPYMHPDIIKLMETVKENDMQLQLITNGTLLRNDGEGDKMNATLELADNVVFSIDAPNAEIHDTIRGRRNAFAKAIANLKTLADAVAKKGKGPGIEIDTTIVSANINVLADMIEFSKQFGDVLVDYDPAQTQGPGTSTDKSIIEIPEGVIEAVFEDLIGHAENGAHISSVAKLQLMKDYLLKKPMSGPCMSLFKDLLIAPDGAVFFCWGWNKVIGNILTPHFKEKWEQAIKDNLEAIDGNMQRCKGCGFSHVRWPDPEAAKIIALMNALRKKYFAGLK